MVQKGKEQVCNFLSEIVTALFFSIQTPCDSWWLVQSQNVRNRKKFGMEDTIGSLKDTNEKDASTRPFSWLGPFRETGKSTCLRYSLCTLHSVTLAILLANFFECIP